MNAEEAAESILRNLISEHERARDAYDTDLYYFGEMLCTGLPKKYGEFPFSDMLIENRECSEADALEAMRLLIEKAPPHIKARAKTIYLAAGRQCDACVTSDQVTQPAKR